MMTPPLKITLCVFLILLGTSVSAADELTIVTEILPPWQTKEGPDVGGIATEVVRATLRELDIEAPIQPYPWSRAYQMAREQPNVLIFSIVRTPQREDLFKWVGVIGSVKEYFFRLKDRRDIHLANFNAAKQYLTVIPRDDYRHQFLINQEFKEKQSFFLVNRQALALRMLYAGRCDLIMDDELTLAYELRQLKLDPEKIRKAIFIPEMSVDFEIAFSRQTPDPLVEKFRAGLVAVKASGLYHEIMRWHELGADLPK